MTAQTLYFVKIEPASHRDNSYELLQQYHVDLLPVCWKDTARCGVSSCWRLTLNWLGKF